MKKIIEDLNLKLLEDYGYREYENAYMKDISSFAFLSVDKYTREIKRCAVFDTRTEPSDDEIQDLLDDDLVEESVD